MISGFEKPAALTGRRPGADRRNLRRFISYHFLSDLIVILSHSFEHVWQLYAHGHVIVGATTI